MRVVGVCSTSSRANCRHGRHWDCIVPVSGGARLYQATALQLGSTPLCVTSNCDLSKIGRENIENPASGRGHVEFSPNRASGRGSLHWLTEVGDISWSEQ